MIQIKPNKGIEQEYWKKVKKHGLVERLLVAIRSESQKQPLKRFFACLLRNDCKYLKHLILGTPHQLSRFIKLIDSFLKKHNIEVSYDNENKIPLKNVFNYTSFKNNHGYWFTSKLIKTNTCAYCNRQYTLTVGSGATGDKYGSPQLDHFYDKGDHPYLALSLYNLVPSCGTCNGSSGKGKPGVDKFSVEKNIHPYIEGYDDDARFEIQIKDVASFYGDASKDIGVKLAISRDCDDAKKDRITKNKGVFALDAAYTQHQDIAKELLQKRNMSDGKYLKELQKTYSNWHLSTADAYQLAFGNFYEKDEFIKRPLAKFTRDLAEQLQLILPKKKQEDK